MMNVHLSHNCARAHTHTHNCISRSIQERVQTLNPTPDTRKTVDLRRIQHYTSRGGVPHLRMNAQKDSVFPWGVVHMVTLVRVRRALIPPVITLTHQGTLP